MFSKEIKRTSVYLPNHHHQSPLFPHFLPQNTFKRFGSLFRRSFILLLHYIPSCMLINLLERFLYEISPSHCFQDVEKWKRAICQINTNEKRGWPSEQYNLLCLLLKYFLGYSKINKALYQCIKSHIPWNQF